MAAADGQKFSSVSRRYCAWKSKVCPLARILVNTDLPRLQLCDFVNTCLRLSRVDTVANTATRKVVGGRTRCQSGSDKPQDQRQRAREGLRLRFHPRSRTSVSPRGRARRSVRSMTQVPLLAAADDMTGTDDQPSMVMLEVGIPGDTWRYCVERQRLAERSEWFRALLLGPMAPSLSDPLPTIPLHYVEKRAFDQLLRHLHDEQVTFQSVSTARSTLDVAHQYLCGELAQLAVNYLEENLRTSTVLEVYQGLSLFASDPVTGLIRTPTSGPSAPPAPGDDASEIAVACARLLHACLQVIDSDPEAVLQQERFEELNGQEVANLASRDSLRLPREGPLFSALERWAASECRRHGMEPTPANKRRVLSDDVLFCVRYLLMSDQEFIEGPMASGMLTIEESRVIVSKILGHSADNETMQGPVTSLSLTRLNNMPRARPRHSDSINNGRSGKKERDDNKKNRRKECASQGQRACARIGDCIVRVLACVFD